MASQVLASHALVSLDEACAQIGIAVGDDDDAVIRTINRASARVAAFLGRAIHYDAAIVESVAGFGTTDLVLSRFPIVAVASIAFDGVAQAIDFDLNSKSAGVLYRRTGWTWTTIRNPGVAQDPLPDAEEKLFSVAYSAGWWTSAQGPASALPAGATLLPDDIEQAALELVSSMYSRRGSGTDVASESLLGYSVTYRPGVAADGSWTAGLPPDVAAMLMPHKGLVQA